MHEEFALSIQEERNQKNRTNSRQVEGEGNSRKLKRMNRCAKEGKRKGRSTFPDHGTEAKKKARPDAQR